MNIIIALSLTKYALEETATLEKKQLTDVKKASHIYVNNLSTKLMIRAFTITFDLICLSLSVFLYLETKTCHDFDINQHE